MAQPNVLVYDIETSPNIVYSWKTGYKLNISHENIIEERKVICVAYKYLGSKSVFHLEWDLLKRDDTLLIKEFGNLLNHCDVAIAHNGDSFDLKWLKGRAFLLGLPPINLVPTIDTLKLARANFNLNSNTLDYLAKKVTDTEKINVSFKLWKDIMSGDPKALNKMVRYCKRDVIALEKLYYKLAPHSHRLPVHMGALLNGDINSCPACGETQRVGHGVVTLSSGQYKRYKCINGHIYRDRHRHKE